MDDWFTDYSKVYLVIFSTSLQQSSWWFQDNVDHKIKDPIYISLFMMLWCVLVLNGLELLQRRLFVSLSKKSLHLCAVHPILRGFPRSSNLSHRKDKENEIYAISEHEWNSSTAWEYRSISALLIPTQQCHNFCKITTWSMQLRTTHAVYITHTTIRQTMHVDWL